MFTDSVRHGLLLEVHVLVVTVEPQRLVREHLGREREQEAAVVPVELGPQRPRVGGVAAKDVALLLPHYDEGGALLEDGRGELGEALALRSRVEERAPLAPLLGGKVVVEEDGRLRAEGRVGTEVEALAGHEGRLADSGRNMGTKITKLLFEVLNQVSNRQCKQQ